MSLLEITGLTHAFGGQPLFQNAAFALHRGEHVGVVGRNGAGKSTLLKLCTGQLVPDGGRIVWQGGIRVGCLDQYAALNPEHFPSPSPVPDVLTWRGPGLRRFPRNSGAGCKRARR